MPSYAMQYALVSVDDYRETVKRALAAYYNPKVDFKSRRPNMKGIFKKVIHEVSITQDDLGELRRLCSDYDNIVKLNQPFDDKFREHAQDVLKGALDYLDGYEGGRELTARKNVMKKRLRQIENGNLFWGAYFDSAYWMLFDLQKEKQIFEEEDSKLDTLVEELHQLMERTRIT